MLWRRRPNVHRLTRNGGITRLVAALGYHDYITDRLGRLYDLGASVRRDAALALATVPEGAEPDVGAALIRSLRDPSGEVRSAAASALGARREQRAVPALAEAALTWSDPRYERARDSALAALAALAGPGTPEDVVATVIDHGDGMARAIDVLDVTIEDNGEDSAQAVGAALLALSRRNGSAADRAAEVLVWLGSDSVEPLLGALERGNRSPAAIRALGRLRDLRATDTLSRLLFEDDPEVRRASAQALADISDPRARGRLLEACGDADHGVREAALDALHRLSPLPLGSEVAIGPATNGSV